MNSSLPIVIVTCLALVLSGCLTASDDPEPHDHSDHDHPDGGDGGNNTDQSGTDLPPLATVVANVTSGEAPFSIQFNFDSPREGAEFYDWTFDADDDGKTDAEGYGLPANTTFVYTVGGDYTPTLSYVSLEGTTGNVSTSLTITDPPAPVIPPQRWFNGTITGVSDQEGGHLVGGPIEHKFNVTAGLTEIKAVLTVGQTALDLDWDMLRPDGNASEESGAFNDPTGTVYPAADPPLIETDPEDLAMTGEWTILLKPYLSVEGEYSIHLTFA